MSLPPAKFDPAQQRARAKRTVIVLAVVAATIYVAFILRLLLLGR
jgi:hypothetical protein